MLVQLMKKAAISAAKTPKNSYFSVAYVVNADKT